MTTGRTAATSAAGAGTETPADTSGGPVAGTIQHLEIYVRDLERSSGFWEWLLGWLGYVPHQLWDEGFSWRLGGSYVQFVAAPEPGRGYDRRAVGLNHVAFRAESVRAVDELTEELHERGVKVLYEDRHPHAGGPDHYAVFFEDPDGIKVEVVAPVGDAR